MRVGILGTLAIERDGQPVDVAGGRLRALLARRALDAGRTVSVDQLVDDLWGEDVPESAVKMVHIHVSALRKALPEGMIRTRPPGYALELPDNALDLDRFERLRSEGREALSISLRVRYVFGGGGRHDAARVRAL